MPSANIHNRNIETLYQLHPKQKSQHPYSKSKTESLESFIRAALSEYGRLKVNGTIPNHRIQLNYQTELSVKEIQKLWKQHSRRLRNAGIVARVTIEITKDKWQQRPVNRVHYHFVAKDNRTQDELQELFDTICRCGMDQSDFNVKVLPFDKALGGWKNYIAYFVKLRNRKGKKNYLFARGLRLRKYFTINAKQWWTYPDGTPRELTSIESEMKRYNTIKRRLAKSEKFIAIQFPSLDTKRPTDYARLKALLDKHNDKVLYDWYSILLGKPTVFHTLPPDWLLKTIHGQPQQCNDLFLAIETRLRHTENLSVFYALQIYHKW